MPFDNYIYLTFHHQMYILIVLLILLNVYSKNGKYWDEKFMEIAKENSCKKIRFGTRRNYRGFIRKYNYKLAGYILEKGVK